jgi:pentatricopeptide repeat protein
MRHPPRLALLPLLLVCISCCLGDAEAFATSASTSAVQQPQPPPPSQDNDDASTSSVSRSRSSSLDVLEERERREMSWLVRHTSRLLGSGDDCKMVGVADSSSSEAASANGTSKSRRRRGQGQDLLTPADMRQLAPVMRAWARRSSSSSPKGRRGGGTSGSQAQAPQGPGADSPYVVQRLLDRVRSEQSDGNPAAVLTTRHCNLLIEAWCRRGGAEALRRAEDVLLRDMLGEGEGEEGGESEPRTMTSPNARSVNMILKGWVKAVGDGDGGPDGADEEEEAMAHVEGMLRRAEERQLANLRGYNLYLSALHLPRRNREGQMAVAAAAAAELAEETLDRMRRHGVPPDANSYLQCILAWSKVGGRESAERAQRLFRRIEGGGLVPTTDCYNALLSCWNRSGGRSAAALQNVRSIVEEMDERFQSTQDEDARPNQTTINTALTVLSKDRTLRSMKLAAELFQRAEEVYGIELDTLSYNLMIKFYSDMGNAEGPIELLDAMERQFRSTTFGAGRAGPTSMPDAVTYVSVINAITSNSKGPGRGKKAEEILRRMDTLHRNALGVRQSAEVFNAVINAWAVSRDRHAVRHAEKLLKEMEARASNGEEALRPNRKTYNTMLKVYASQGQGEEAEALLDRMEDAADSYSYCTCINAYAKSSSQDKAKKGVKILHRMADAYESGNASAKPNVQAFNSCLNCCAYTSAAEEKIEAFLIAVSAFLMLEKYAEPDHVTFATFLKAVSKLIPRGEERRRQVVDVVFHRCCRDGLVSPFVLQQLSFAASSEQYHSLLKEQIESPGKRVAMKDIPTEWMRNVPAGRNR